MKAISPADSDSYLGTTFIETDNMAYTNKLPFQFYQIIAVIA